MCVHGLRRIRSAAALINLCRGAIGAALLLAAAVAANAQTQSTDFDQFVSGLWPIAHHSGISQRVFAEAFAGVKPDPTVAARLLAQPEFDRPIETYIEAAVSAGRIKRAIAASKKWHRELALIEAKFGVPPEIVLAVLGMETDFAPPKGNLYVVRSLATLAALGRPASSFSDELIAALQMLQRGIAKTALQGSWAGAMGYPQFLPSAYLKYAIRFDATDSGADIWTSVPDSLASIANFLKSLGWTSNLSWGSEVRLPLRFDFRTLHADFAEFADLGLLTVDGSALPQHGPATLYFPAGAGGPAFLLSDNYWIIKQYNNSDAYALSVGLLANRIAGKQAVHTAWPNNGRSLDRDERIRLQEYLAKLGYYDGTIDGKFGPATRDAVHRFQQNAGVAPADGFPSQAVLKRLENSYAR
jgi:membrane-bound lytic murein transglycosylase B